MQSSYKKLCDKRSCPKKKAPQQSPVTRNYRTGENMMVVIEQLLLLFPFFIVMDVPAHVPALPVLGKETPVRALLYSGMVLFATDEALHEAGLLIDKPCRMLLFGHNVIIGSRGVKQGRLCFKKIQGSIDFIRKTSSRAKSSPPNILSGS
jgi:hypothetical protein